MVKMRSLLALGALGAMHITGVLAQQAACIPVCISQFTATPANYSCQDGGDACLCNSAAFKADVSSCAWTSCQALDAQVKGYFDDFQCKGVVSSTVATTTAAATTTTAAESTTAISTTAAATTNTSSTEATSQPTTVTGATSSSSSATPSATKSESSSEASITTTSSASPHKTSEVNDETGAATSGAGLSKGAAVGIGVGVGVAAIAIIAVVVALLLRRKRQQQKPSPHPVEISRPMPGGGRTYASPDHGSISEKRGGESFEMTSQRYEDMLPRTTPRTMV